MSSRCAALSLLLLTAAVCLAAPAPTSQPTSAPAPHALASGAGTLLCPDVIEPLRPFAVTLQTSTPSAYTLRLDNRPMPIEPGKPLVLQLSGSEGPRKLEVVRDGKPIGSVTLQLRAETTFEAGPFTALFNRLREQIRKDRSTHRGKNGPIHSNPTWFRDHVHEMKGYKLWEQDLSSYADALLDLQHPDGFFYEILIGGDRDHLAFVSDRHRLVSPRGTLSWVRLELEADVEYLMVEAAYTIWQATGDDAAMRARLPHLERALTYDFTDPTRWDREHGALKRPFTIDTWDFAYGQSTENRRIEPNGVMGIMHGDNSGLYQACRQLAAMFRAAGQPDKGREWDEKAAGLRERVNRLCFNGRFYTHQVLLKPVDMGVREQDILSLSNPYDINRGLPTHEMAVKIIDEYRARRESRRATHFAEWFSIDPPYPQFVIYKAGQYINGGIAGFVAGELAKAALNEGREAYGADILRRVADMVAKDGSIYFLYTPQGKNQGGGPSGWAAAASLSALMEGLAGIHDDAVLYQRATLSPRFLAAGLDTAHVCARYGPSGAYIAMDYEHRPAEHVMRFKLAGVADSVHLRILLPPSAMNAEFLSPAGLKGHIETIELSRYLVADWTEPLSTGVAEFAIRYAN